VREDEADLRLLADTLGLRNARKVLTLAAEV
jgi:hypothetical protein